MAIIREDKIGLYSEVGGWIARPTYDQISNLKVGDKLKCYHFGGSTRIGMGYLGFKGKYQEYWRTTELAKNAIH